MVSIGLLEKWPAAIFQTCTSSPAGKKRVFCPLRLRVGRPRGAPGRPFFGHVLRRPRAGAPPAKSAALVDIDKGPLRLRVVRPLGAPGWPFYSYHTCLFSLAAPKLSCPTGLSRIRQRCRK